MAGCLFGKSLLDWPPSQGPRIAALRGAAIASAALLLFAPLFATVYIWTGPPKEHWTLLGLTLMLLLGSAVAVWWLAAVRRACGMDPISIGFARFRETQMSNSSKVEVAAILFSRPSAAYG